MGESQPSPARVYDALIEHSEDCISVLAPDGRTVFQSAGVTRQLGYAPEEMIGRSKLAIVHPDDVEAAEARLRRVMAGEPTPDPVRLRCRHKDGTWRLLDVATSLYTDPDGARFVVLNSQDVTAVTAVAQALRASEQRLDLALEIGGMGVSEFDFRTGEVIFSNSFARLMGYDAPPASDGYEWFMRHVHAEDRAEVDAGVSAGLQSRGEFELVYRLIRRDGAIRWWHGRARIVRDEQGQPARVLGLVSDITDRRHLEEQVRQAQKLEAIGQLAGGVAHDFNNLLTVITGYAETLLGSLPATDPHVDDVVEIRRAADRAAMLTQQLLAFSRKQILQPEIVDANAVVRDIAAMIGRLIGGAIELKVDLAPGIASVLVDRGQLEQVLMNLAVNGRDAMPAGGRLEMKTRIVSITEADAARLYPIRPGTYVRLSVCDSGIGMAPEVRARAFEPFFTTKDPGKGTGIGLSTVYGIVKQSGGFIFLESEPGAGTTFDVYMPMSDAPAVDEGNADDHDATAAAAATVLLVEDYRRVRDLARKVLTRQGYRVLSASSGREALEILGSYQGPIDVLVTDVLMAEMTGPELAARVQAQRPEVAVLYMSGFAGDLLTTQGIDRDDAAFLEKPFTPAALSRKVREVLKSADPKGPPRTD
jgi:two-component system, cell cycle sensor histidine kinase and response regulator CckA